MGEDFVLVAFFHHPIFSCTHSCLPNRETAGSMKLRTVGFAGAHRTHSSSPCLSAPTLKKKGNTKIPFRDGEEIERNINKFEAHLDGLDEYVDMFTKVILLDSSAMDSVFGFPCRKT